MATFLPLVVYLVMTLVMCPNILSGINYKDENDKFVANMERMFHPDYGQKVATSVAKSYDDSDDVSGEKSFGSAKSYHSPRSADYKSGSPRDSKTYVLEDMNV